jgi:hypothetical protein
MQNFKMQDSGLCLMSSSELNSVNGGEWPSWVKGLGLVTVANEIISHWEEIKTGLEKGWNDAN